MPIPTTITGVRAYQDDRSHVFHSWSAQAHCDPIVIDSSHGSYIVDADGREFLDFSCQLVYTNLGHQHPAVIAAIKEQAEQLCTIAPGYANDKRSEAARLIAQRMPEGINKVFFTNGGADAVEHAIRMARLYTGRRKVLSSFRGYHGATHTTLTISGDNRRWPIDDSSSGAVHFFPPFLYRTVFHSQNEEEECARALEHVEALITMEGSDTIAAFIMETIPGTAGIMPPPAGYWKGIREICDRYGIVMICDEVMVGFGRTGSWFAFEDYGVIPDLVTFAKGVNSGYVPLGGVAIHDRIAHTFDEVPYPGGLTYSGHPLATAAAVAAIRAMEEERVIDNAHRMGEDIISPFLEKLAEDCEIVGDIRGRGAFWAIELVKDKQTQEPLCPYGTVSSEMKDIVATLRDRGLVIFSAMNRLHICPPLNIEDDDLSRGLSIIREVLMDLNRHTPTEENNPVTRRIPTNQAITSVETGGA